MVAEHLQQPNSSIQQVKAVSNTLDNKADLVRLFELLIKIDRRVNATGSYETQNNRNTDSTNKTK